MYTGLGLRGLGFFVLMGSFLRGFRAEGLGVQGLGFTVKALRAEGFRNTGASLVLAEDGNGRSRVFREAKRGQRKNNDKKRSHAGSTST